MPRHFEKRLVPYTARQMFDLVADVARYPEFLPWCLDAHVAKVQDNKIRAVLHVGYRAFHDTFTSHVTLSPCDKIVVDYGGGPLKSLSNEWGFAPTGDGQCEISFSVAFEFKSFLLGAMMDMFFEKAFYKMVEAFEKRAEDLYGPPSRS